MNPLYKCDECGDLCRNPHEAANNKSDRPEFIYICDYCWDKRLYEAFNLPMPTKEQYYLKTNK